MSISDERLAHIVGQIDEWGETYSGHVPDILTALTELQSFRAAAKVRAIREGDAVRDVLEERQRQVAKGYDAAHDDEHVDCEILTHPIWGIAARAHNARTIMMPLAYRRAVVELAAMSLAEIERLDRSLFPGALK